MLYRHYLRFLVNLFGHILTIDTVKPSNSTKSDETSAADLLRAKFSQRCRVLRWQSGSHSGGRHACPQISAHAWCIGRGSFQIAGALGVLVYRLAWNAHSAAVLPAMLDVEC